jgi:hypothetical protein
LKKNLGIHRYTDKAIEHELKKEKMSLKQEYAEANKDPERLETIKEWETLDLEG